jgi:hypothetical protein
MTRTAVIELMTWAMGASSEQQKEIAELITRKEEDLHLDKGYGDIDSQTLKLMIKQVSR